MILTISNEVPFQILSSSFSIGPSQTGYELQVGADSRSFSTLFSVGANTPRMVTNVANGSYFRLKNNVGDVKVNWQRVCVDEGGGSGSGTELTPVAEFPLGAAEGTVVALASGDTVGLYQFIDGEWVLVGADDPTKLLAVNELPATAEPGTVMALYQEGEAGGGTWEWDEASEEYVFNCNFSTLDTAATYDLGSPLGSDVSGCYNYENINLHYDNGWKVTTNLRICDGEIDEQGCENQGGTWICGEYDCNCSLYSTIELSPSTDPNNGFGIGDLCWDTERVFVKRFYWDPADLKLKYVMIDDNDEVTHYRYDCYGVPDLRNITGGTPSEPILGLYQYDGQNWNEVGGVDLSAYWTSAQTKDYVDSGFWTSAQTKTYVDSAVSGIDLSNYYTKVETDSAITAVEDHIYDVEKVAASALTELHADISEVQEQIDTMDEVVSEALVDLNERIGEISGSTGGGDILTPSTGFGPDDEIGSVRSVNGTEGSWAYWVQTVSAASTSVTYTYYQSVPSELTGNVASIGYNSRVIDAPFIKVNKTLSSLAVDYSGLTSNTYTIDYSNATSGETNDYLRFISTFVNFYCKFNIKWQINGSNLVVEITLSMIPDEEPLPSGASGRKWDPLQRTAPYRVDIYLIGENTPGIPGGVKVLTADGAKTLATEDYVSAATAGKADAADMYIPQHPRFPLWNTQGIITGTTGYDYFNKDNSINGITYTIVTPNNSSFKIYGPTTPGTAGDILVSTGNRAPVWSAMTAADVTKAYVDSAITEVQDQIDTMDDVVSAALVDLNDRKVESTSVSTIRKVTQAEYDAIVTKDASTLYIIVNNS